MGKLRGFIFSLDGVALAEGTVDAAGKERRAEFKKLIRFLVSKGVRPIVLANRPWTIRNTTTGKTVSAKEHYQEVWGPEVRWYIAQEDGFPPKPQAAALDHVLGAEKLAPNDVVFLGNDVDDMRTAVNGNVLFLTAAWHPSAPTTEYGFHFDSARDVARFVDLFCLRDHLWFYEEPAINLRSLGLISKFDGTAGKYSGDAISTFKYKVQTHRDFWTKYLVSTLYFAGIHQTPNLLVAPYPGHAVGFDNEVVRDALITFAKCFRMSYCPDLIVRHTTALKSQAARISGTPLSHKVQLESIHLTEKPSRYGAKPYKNSPFKTARSVLVVDDFTTEGYGLDSARAYLRAVKKIDEVILVSLGRFPNRNLHELRPLPSIANPFVPNTFPGTLPVVVHPYSQGVISPKSTQEIAEHFSAYDTWSWPAGL